MKVLVACEESQTVCKAFRAKGFEAYSCDIQDCSGGHPEWHIKGDCLDVINQDWDLIIAHPPCTYLTVSGNAWFNIERYGDKARKRYKDREEAVDFFLKIANAKCYRIAIENPIGVMSKRFKKATQIIQPYFFGDEARKTTCLWLKNLPKLEATKIVSPGDITAAGHSVNASANYAVKNGKILSWSDPETAKIRSKTFPGIAEAMAQQWGDFLLANANKQAFSDLFDYSEAVNE